MPDYLSPNLIALLQGMLTVDPVKRFTIPEVLKHSWVRHNLPAYLRQSRQHDLVVPPPLDSLSSLLQATTIDDDPHAVPIAPELAKLDPLIVNELAQKIGVNSQAVEEALFSSEGENAVKVAYALCSDRINNCESAAASPSLAWSPDGVFASH